MEFKHNNKRGLGYNAAPPPYNHNYFSFPITKEEEEMEKTMVYGKQPLSNFVEAGSVKPIDIVKTWVNDTNVYTSCADTVLIEDWTGEDDMNVLPDATLNSKTFPNNLNAS